MIWKIETYDKFYTTKKYTEDDFFITFKDKYGEIIKLNKKEIKRIRSSEKR